VPLEASGATADPAINIQNEGPEKTLSIQIIPKNLLPPIAAAQQVINSSFVLNSQLARHPRVVTHQEVVSIVRTRLPLYSLREPVKIDTGTGG
jgi:hypothetical protein